MSKILTCEVCLREDLWPTYGDLRNSYQRQFSNFVFLVAYGGTYVELTGAYGSAAGATSERATINLSLTGHLRTLTVQLGKCMREWTYSNLHLREALTGAYGTAAWDAKVLAKQPNFKHCKTQIE